MSAPTFQEEVLSIFGHRLESIVYNTRRLGEQFVNIVYTLATLVFEINYFVLMILKSCIGLLCDIAYDIACLMVCTVMHAMSNAKFDSTAVIR